MSQNQSSCYFTSVAYHLPRCIVVANACLFHCRACRLPLLAGPGKWWHRLRYLAALCLLYLAAQLCIARISFVMSLLCFLLKILMKCCMTRGQVFTTKLSTTVVATIQRHHCHSQERDIKGTTTKIICKDILLSVCPVRMQLPLRLAR